MTRMNYEQRNREDKIRIGAIGFASDVNETDIVLEGEGVPIEHSVFKKWGRRNTKNNFSKTIRELKNIFRAGLVEPGSIFTEAMIRSVTQNEDSSFWAGVSCHSGKNAVELLKYVVLVFVEERDGSTLTQLQNDITEFMNRPYNSCVGF